MSVCSILISADHAGLKIDISKRNLINKKAYPFADRLFTLVIFKVLLRRIHDLDSFSAYGKFRGVVVIATHAVGTYACAIVVFHISGVIV